MDFNPHDVPEIYPPHKSVEFYLLRQIAFRPADSYKNKHDIRVCYLSVLPSMWINSKVMPKICESDAILPLCVCLSMEAGGAVELSLI